ncbi:MAG: hypothetical protein JRI97_05995 [Deltaproteobacteria bacterium]|nr:hypothetical protein [Deltaproteobacteria bacterium]
MKPVVWKQSRINTCGPASLMAALHELGIGGLSVQRELTIFRRVRHAYILGSTPAYLARYALAQGVDARLVQKTPLPSPVPGKNPVQRILHAHLFKVYAKTAEEYRLAGLPFGQYQEECDILPPPGPDLSSQAIFLVTDTDGVLHFILARRHQGSLVVLDPDKGVNTRVSGREFLDRHRQDFMGYCVLLRR